MTVSTVRRINGGKKIRNRQRLAHLTTGALLVIYVYLPVDPGALVQAAIRWVVLPLLVIDGILMWQWPKVRRVARRLGTRS